MYISPYFYLLLSFIGIESMQGCSINCGDECACVAPEGLESDCSGFRGCHKECPTGTRILGCSRTLTNHTSIDNEFSDNNDEHKIELNIKINIKGIESKGIAYRHRLNPNSKVNMFNSRKDEDSECKDEAKGCIELNCNYEYHMCAETCGLCGLDARNIESCGRSKISKGTNHRLMIIGGKEIIPHSEPWLAMLFIGRRPWAGCGATLISQTFAFTAAHCDGAGYHGNITQADTLKLGGHNRKMDDGSELFVSISKWHNHPNVFDFVHKKKYGEWRMTSMFWWDISLLQLEKDVKFTSHIQPACLPSLPNQDYSGKDVFTTGWGRTEKGSYSDVPKIVRLKAVSPNTCTSTYGETKLGKEICEKHCQKDVVLCTYGQKKVRAKGKDWIEDACGGDSGGPLVSYDDENKAFLIGIVSFGYGCGGYKRPGMFSKVDHVMQWMNGIMNR